MAFGVAKAARSCGIPYQKKGSYSEKELQQSVGGPLEYLLNIRPCNYGENFTSSCKMAGELQVELFPEFIQTKEIDVQASTTQSEESSVVTRNINCPQGVYYALVERLR